MGEVKGEVFFGGGGEIDDPEFTGAVFNDAVVGLVVDEEAAVLHEGNSPARDALALIGSGLFLRFRRIARSGGRTGRWR